LDWSLPEQYPRFVNVVSFGKSHEGRDLLGLRITAGQGTKPRAVWFDGGIHAREWISPATVIYMTRLLLESYGTVDAVTEILDRLEVFVLPVFNVDGYAYTLRDRLWRKTRRPNPGSTCIGTDPNRNWGFEWGGPGASTNPCSETFRGPNAFSEVEVKAVADFIESYGKFYGYINFHSYSQMWLAPWGYTNDRPPAYTAQNNLGRDATAALTKVHGTPYVYGPIYTVIYPASGGSNDYTYGKLGVVHSYAPELRPNAGTGNGFILPASQIVPTATETFEALKVWALACINL